MTFPSVENGNNGVLEESFLSGMVLGVVLIIAFN